MRLPPSLIELLARRLVMNLIERGVIASDHPEKTIDKVIHLITDDLRIEDEITEEARQILLDHQDELKGQDLEYHRLIQKVKIELAAKRGYVL
jgi:hypothetical protein